MPPSSASRFADPQELFAFLTPRAIRVIAASVIVFTIVQLSTTLLPPILRLGGSLVAGGLLIVGAAVWSQREAATARVRQAVSLGIVNRGIERRRGLSLYDPQTGLYNLWYFELRLEEEVQRCRRYGAALSVLVLKAQPTADRREDEQRHADVASKLGFSLRDIDLASALGLLEYAFCLPSTDATGAAAMGARLAASMSGGNWQFGVAAFDESTTGKKILAQAREAVGAPSTARAATTSSPVRPSVVVSEAVSAGGQIEVEAQVLPFAPCELVYISPSGRRAQIARLSSPHYADSKGMARWSWRVSRKTRPGTFRIEVTSGGATGCAEATIIPARRRTGVSAFAADKRAS